MISVVIPLYNKENAIRSTIDSVLGQSCQDFEMIVVDDGSKDASAEVVESIQDSRIRLIRKENGGVSSARNAGIMAANSDYIAFLDGDDLWDKDFLSEIVKLISTCPEAGILGTSYNYDKGGKLERAPKPLEDGFFGLVDNSHWDKAHLYCSSAVCCRKEALESVGMFDERIAYGEDTDVWWRIMLQYPAAFSNKALAVYRFDEDNRAMERTIPLEKLHFNYFEKYAEARRTNDAFRHFIDKECMWWMYPYILKDPKNKEVRRVISQIDFKEYKPSFRFRFRFPQLYNCLKRHR